MPDGHRGQRLERVGIVAIGDQAGDFVVLVGDEEVFEAKRERQVGEEILGGDAFLGGVRGESAASPASESPDRCGVAFASSVRRSANECERPARVMLQGMGEA